VSCIWGVSEQRRCANEDVGTATLPGGTEASHAATAVAGTIRPRHCHAQSAQPTQVGG